MHRTSSAPWLTVLRALPQTTSHGCSTEDRWPVWHLAKTSRRRICSGPYLKDKQKCVTEIALMRAGPPVVIQCQDSDTDNASRIMGQKELCEQRCPSEMPLGKRGENTHAYDTGPWRVWACSQSRCWKGDLAFPFQVLGLPWWGILLGPHYDSWHRAHMWLSQGLPFLGESAKFLSCLEQITGELEWSERRKWRPTFLGIH